MIENPLVSIIICTKSRIGTLKAALETAMSQTYKNTEIIVVLSTRSEDNSQEFLTELKAQDMIRLVLNDGNRIDARNKGLRVAKGDFICFLDDDDAMLRNRVEIQLNYLLQNEDVGAVGCTTMFDSSSALSNTLVHQSHFDIVSKLEGGEDIDTIVNFQSCMFRKSVLDKCYPEGNPFDKLFIAGGEGQFMMYDMMFNHYVHFATIPYTIYLYHVGAASNSLTANVDPVFYNEYLYGKSFEDKMNFVKSFKEMFAKIEEETEEVTAEQTEAPTEQPSETPTEAPKKRGRKKKETEVKTDETPTEAPKKRRGRPKKTEI